MFSFSNLTPEEIIRYHGDSIPDVLLKAFEGMAELLHQSEERVKSCKRRIEILEEQVYFAQELVGSLDTWAKSLPKTKHTLYMGVRENTQFET